MKYLNLLLHGLLIATLISSCEREENHNNQTLLGKWTYSEDYSQTFDFQNSTDVLINSQEFLYEIEGDSIEFSYNGHLYIAIIPSKHKFEKLSDRDYLEIENLDRLQFFNGKEGENILFRGIIPNDFIGYWINVEQNDTLIFLTNERIERPHGYYNDWYEYTLTTDSLRVCTPPNATYSTKFLSINCGSRNLSPDVFVSLMFCIT